MESNIPYNNIQEDIPDDIQKKILIRLPLKSLLACSYVCKRWKTMICDDDFKTRYLLRSTTRHMDPTPESLFHSICRRPRRYTVSAPIRGWICVKSSFMLRLYNPITDEVLSLPEYEFEEIGEESDEIFGYDEANGVFKVLGFFSSSFGAYTVRPGGEGSWRPIACEPPHMYINPLANVNSFPPLSFTNALCKGGVLYYAALISTQYAPIIMSFDLNYETFDYNQLPEGFIVDHRSKMVNYNGKVALVTNSATELRNTEGFQICVRNENSGQWVSERVEIPGWGTTVWSKSLFSFLGTIGSTGQLVYTTVSSSLEEPEYVLYYTPGKEITTPVTLEGANKEAYHYVRACLNHFECLFRTT